MQGADNLTVDEDNISNLISEWRGGAVKARDRLFEKLFPQLQEIARASLNRYRSNVSLETGDLLHNAFLKIENSQNLDLADKCHLLSLSAKVMQQILMDHLRAKSRLKRKGIKITVREDLDLPAQEEFEFSDLAAALRKLEEVNADRAKMVQMRYFAGMTAQEIALVLGCSVARIKREWPPTLGWLRGQITDDAGTDSG